MINYDELAKIFKVLNDPKRLKIINMLSTGELCACKIQEAFDVSQPTLSHHMNVLCTTGLVSSRKEGKWMYYTLNKGKIDEVQQVIGELFIPCESAGVL